MKVFYLIYNKFIKLYIFFSIANLILEQEDSKKEVNNLEYYFSQSICLLNYFTINYNCLTKFYTNDNFYNDILEINNNINLLMNINKSKLENIFLLLVIIPFLQNNSTLTYKIKDKGIYKHLRKEFKKKIKYKTIKFDYNDLNYFKNNIKNLLYYKWELIPKQFILNNFRHIINKYYNESNLRVFHKSLNINYDSYIQNKANGMTFIEIQNLLSKN